MANPVLGKSLCSDWFFLGEDFSVRTVSMTLGRFRTDLAALGPYCHELRPIFPSTALALG